MTTPPVSSQRLSACITGWVQGVYFRAYTRRQAQQLGLDGWVRNERDGSVRVEAEGARALLEMLLEAVRRGPTGARVDTVTVDWSKATGEYEGFAVRFR